MKKLSNSVFTISFFILISRITGLFRDLLIAKFVGVTMLSDVFLAAFRLPNLFRKIFAEGALNNSFVPIFIGKTQEEKDDHKAVLFAKNILSLLIFAILLLIIVIQIFMPYVMTILLPGFKNIDQKFTLLVNLSKITIFYLLFISIVSFFSGILHSFNKFIATSITPIILNLTLILSIYLLSPFMQNIAYALSWGVFIAGFLQVVWILTFSIKKRMLVYPIIPKIDKDVKKFFRKFIPGVLGANVMQINQLVDTMIASLVTGAISYLYYADRINQLPIAMIGVAIGTVLLPNLSRKIKDKKYKESIAIQNNALELSLLLTIPASLGLFILSEQIVSFLFERGEFVQSNTINVSKILKLYALALPAFVIVKILNPSFFAREDTRTPLIIAMICLFSNIVLNLILFRFFSYFGVVLSSIVSSYLNMILLFLILKKNNYFTLVNDFGIRITKIIIASLFMLTILLLMNNYIKLLNDGLELIIFIVTGLCSFMLIAYFLGSLKILKIF